MLFNKLVTGCQFPVARCQVDHFNYYRRGAKVAKSRY